MRVAYNKLVRDQIPGIIASAGSEPSTRVLDQVDYRSALRGKLLEEAREAEAASDGRLASELADVLEVIRALAKAHDMSWEDIELEADASEPNVAGSTAGSSSSTSTRLTR